MHLYENEMESFTNFSTYRQMKYIYVFIPPILLIIGSFGNIMVPIVLYRHSRVISTYVYLISLAIADQIVLLFGMTPKWLQHTFGTRLEIISTITCKFYTFISITVSQVAVWLIVVVTVERMIVVSLPFKAPQHITVTRALICVIIVVGFFLTINSPLFFTVDLIDFRENDSNLSEINNDNNMDYIYKTCDFKTDISLPVTVIWSWFDALFYSYLPCLIIIFANIIIIHFLRTAHKRRLLMQCNTLNTNCHNTTMNNSRQTSYHYKSTNQSSQQLLMLILVSWVFVLTVIPVSIFKTVFNIMKKQDTDFLNNQKTNSEFLLINAIVETIMTTNHSINFFLYCIAGKKFRTYFFLLLSCSKHSNNHYHNNNNNNNNNTNNNNNASIIGGSGFLNSNCSRKFDRNTLEISSKCKPTVSNEKFREVLIECCTEV